MSSNSLFSQKMLSNIKKTHNIFLWVATGIMIVSLVLGAILIFVDTKNDMFGKIQGTFFILALAAFICVNNFIRIEKGGKLIQGFASAGFLANIVWLVLSILMIWGVCTPVQVATTTVRANNASTRTYELYDEYDSEYDDYDELDDYDDYDYYDDDDDEYDYSDYEMDDVYYDVAHPSSYTPKTYTITVAARILIVAISIATIGFWVSNVLAIKDRMKAVKPLKITAIVCVVYGAVFVIIMALAWPVTVDQNLLKWVELSGLTASGFIITALAAWIISRTHKEVDLSIVENEPVKIEPVVDTTKNEEIVAEESVGDGQVENTVIEKTTDDGKVEEIVTEETTENSQENM